MLAFAALLATVSGCNRFREHAKPDTVYVVAQQTYLRDRVAAVSTRVALVSNGDGLEVVERGRRFLKVKTSKGEVGWIEQHLIIEHPVYDQFLQLKEQHQHDPVVATGVLRDALYLHLKPGRETERFYLLPENDKLQLLVRASVPKQAPGIVPVSKPPVPAPEAVINKPGRNEPGKVAAAAITGRSASKPAEEGKEPALSPMEDWWLVRDSQGQVGWLLARRMDVDVPDEIGGYSEGQRMVGAYPIAKVYDPESSLPDKQVPIYLATLNAYKDGLPYDFDQIRVFTWNVKKHRYETAYRQRNLEGYLPVEITQEKVDKGPPVPVFAIRVATSDQTITDPQTGAARPTQTATLRFALEGPIVKRISPPTTQPLAVPTYARQEREKQKAAHQGRTKGGG